nr:glycosyltransferase [Paracoccus liaowanqingii]
MQTTVVSSLAWTPHDYVGPPDHAYVDAALHDLDQEGVTHYVSLPPKAVYDLMDAADYLIFPTFHDTFGFVSIEALASGTPVIATNTCVLPEIIQTGRNGHLLPFDNDRIVGKWSWLYRQQDPGYLEAYEAATASLSAALFERLAGSWDDRALYEELSAGAVASAYDQFHPQTARRRLEALYERFRPAP